MMDLQKKRTSTKKIKSNKSQALLELPLGPLIDQINQLKSELATIKSKKNIKPNKDLQPTNQKHPKSLYPQILSAKPELKGDKTTSKLTLQPKNKDDLKQLIFPIRENELKMNIELNKVYQCIKENNEIKTISSLNKLISYLNNSIKDLEIENRNQDSPIEQESCFNSQRQQIKIYQQLNNQLQKQNIELKHALAKQIDQIEELQSFNAEMKEQYELFCRSLGDKQQEVEKMRMVCGGLREERKQLEEKMKIFQRSIEKKQSEILLYQEDLNFIKMQSEKVKIQKRQTEKLLDSLQKQYRELKNKNDIQIQALVKEKNKWKNQCESRRTTQSVVLGQQEQKTQLKKEIEMIRKQCSCLGQELSQTKQKLCEQQKKCLIYEQRIFKLESQNDKLQRSVEYCKSEMRELAFQVGQLQDESHKYRDLAMKSKMGIKNTGKAQALHQIQQLIKLHRRNEEETE